MSVSVIVTSQKFLNEYKNDPGFASNPGDTTPNLAMSIMENCKIVRQVDIQWGYTSSSNNPLNGITDLGGGVVSFSLPSSKTWANEGFAVGDTHLITWQDASGNQNTTGTVQSISGNVMIMNSLTLPGPGLNGWINNTTNFRGTNNIESLVYGFGLIDNSATAVDIASRVSGNDQQYYTDGIGLGGPRSTSFVPMQSKGQYLDWVTGSMKVRFVSNPIVLFGSNVSQRFEIEHEFMINPYYLDGELTNLQNNVIPTYLFGQNSLKYVSDYQFLISLNNINTQKKATYTEDLGDVAWFNENFNGFNSEYKVNSITYEEQATTNSADGLLIASKTRVKMEVEALNRVFVVGDKVGVYVSYLPTQAQYTNTTLTKQKANFLYDRAFQISGGSGAVGDDFISAFAVFSPSGSIMNLQFDVEYSGTQKAFLSSQNAISPINFLIAVELGDNTLTSIGSDRILLLSDVNEYDESPDIPGLMAIDKFDLFPHNKQIGVDAGFTDLTQWNEDGVAIDFDFTLNLAQQAVLNSLEFKLVAYNTVTQQIFELDSYSYPIFPAIISAGIQQLIANTTRGYILLGGDQFNDVEISVGPLVAQLQHYLGKFAQKISWQEWLSNLGVDTVFFNSAEPNDNLNFKTSNYSLLNDYEIRLAVFANVSGVSLLNVSGITNYYFLSPTITIYDYEEDGGADVWSCVIETFNSVNLTNLGGSIMTGTDTLFKVTWTNSGGPVSSLTGIYGINRIEITDQPGYAITEMSSINAPLPTGSQLLKPSVGTLLDMTIVSGNVVMECLIDGSLINAGTNYNLSSRIHDDNLEGKQKSPSGDLKGKTPTGEKKQKAP